MTLIKLNDKGPDVKRWQEFLNSRGEKLIADGNFGGMTKAATQRFQGAFGLPTDGIVGPNTLGEAAKFGFSFASNVESKTATGKKILISAGHTNVAGQDRGAQGSGYIEGVEATDIRDTLAATLRGRGVTVIEDGADGVNDPLKKALELIAGTDLAIEIHFNAGIPKATGVEVLSKPNRKAIAQRIARAIHDALGVPLRGENGWKADNSGQHHRLAFCERGGLIVEVCFISNMGDMRSYRENFGKMIGNLADVLSEAKYF